MLAMVLACSGRDDKSCKVDPLLSDLLNARDNKTFSDTLLAHGPVREEELPCIIAATKSWSAAKQIRAASLLVIAKGDGGVIFEAERQAVSETKNVVVWATIMETLIYLKHPNVVEVAALRPDLIAEALNYTNGDEEKVQSTGLKAGVMAKIPGIEDELRKRLDSDIAGVVVVALDAMPEEMIKAELQRVLKMLEEYEAGRTYKGFKNSVFASLVIALARSDDPAAFAAAKTAIEVGLTNSHLVRGSRDELQDFRNKIVFIPGDFVEKFYLYLIRENGISKGVAFDIASTRITRKITEPSVDVVRECVQMIERGDPSTDPRKRNNSDFNVGGQFDCERLFHFLESGDIKGKMKFGVDALATGKKWLSEHGH